MIYWIIPLSTTVVVHCTMGGNPNAESFIEILIETLENGSGYVDTAP